MEFVLLNVGLGTIPGIIALTKGRSFLTWWIYGTALLIVALPHALMVKSSSGRLALPGTP